MPRVELGEPPDLGEGASYRDYKPWLLAHFADHICSYCLLHCRALDVEHHEPRRYAEARVNDPRNLLVACTPCNGPGGKHDYHPLHAARQRYRHDSSGHHVLDVRVDDLAELFEIRDDGSIVPRPGDRPRQERAAWNIVLLGLQLKDCREARLEVLNLHRVCEHLLHTGNDVVLARLLPSLARRALLLEVFGVLVSAPLRERLGPALAAALAADVPGAP